MASGDARKELQFGDNSKKGLEIFVNIAYDNLYMVGVAQLVRASGCGPEGREFKSHHSPNKKPLNQLAVFLFLFGFA